MTKNRALGLGTTLAIAIVAAALLVVGGGVAEGKPPPDSPGSQAKAATYFARFGDNGTEAVLVAGNGVVSVSRQPVDQFGNQQGWVVEFAEPIDQCAWTASINPFFGGPPAGWGPIQVGLTWDNTVVPPENQTPDPYVLRVLTSDGNSNWPGYPPTPGPVLETYSVNVAC
jgi:hypothetical protein